MTPQYGHCGVSGTGGNDSVLFTRTDLVRGTSVVDFAKMATAAVCRAVVAFVAGAGKVAGVLLVVAGFGNALGANRTMAVRSPVLGS